MNPATFQGRKTPGPCRSCLRGGPADPCPISCGPLFRYRRKIPDPTPEALGFTDWRLGLPRALCPYPDGSREARAWLRGHALAAAEHEPAPKQGPDGNGARRARWAA